MAGILHIFKLFSYTFSISKLQVLKFYLHHYLIIYPIELKQDTIHESWIDSK